MTPNEWRMKYDRMNAAQLQAAYRQAQDELGKAASQAERGVVRSRLKYLTEKVQQVQMRESLRPGPARQAGRQVSDMARRQNIGPVNAESLRPGPARQAGQRVAQQMGSMDKPRALPPATRAESVARQSSGGPVAIRGTDAVARVGESVNMRRMPDAGRTGGGVKNPPGQGVIDEIIDAEIVNAKPSGNVPALRGPGGPGVLVRGASASSKLGGALKAAGGMLGKVVRNPLVQLGVMATPYVMDASNNVMDALNKRNEELPYGPHGGVMYPPGNKPAAVPAGVAPATKTDTATKTTPASEKKAYPAQGQMSKAMGVTRDSTGQVDKLNPADVKKAQGYMGDLMMRIGKGGWDQPGQERRGTQEGTPGLDKIVQMFKDSKFSDQFTRAEQEEAIKRFKGDFAKQSFRGRNVTPAGRSVTPTAQYTGSPERY